MNNTRERLIQADRLINSGKWKKFFTIPFKYVFSFVYRNVIFRLRPQVVKLQVDIITGDTISILFPSAADIYLYGCKSHSSEIRLTKYLLDNFKQGDRLIDAGAHIGFYSLLVAKLGGKVISLEPSTETYSLLKSNTAGKANIKALNNAAYKTQTTLTFYQYHHMQSEYNTLAPNSGNADLKAEAIKVEAVSVDSLTKDDDNSNRLFIKIDVEGAEMDMLLGTEETIKAHKPIIIMEYFNEYFDNNYVNCVEWLLAKGYTAYEIDANGGLFKTVLQPKVLAQPSKESDNIVFIKE